MAVTGKGKQVASKASATSFSSSGKRKNASTGGESSSAQRKKKRSGVLKFVDDAAADADYDGEEEDDDLEWDDEEFDFELPDLGGTEINNVLKGSKSTPLPFFIKEEEMDDDQLQEAIKERYARGSQFVSYDEDIKEHDDFEMTVHAEKDLSIWKVKCMMGRERQVAFSLMQKFVDLLKVGRKLQIYSVFALDHVKGFVFVEADKACEVSEACFGLYILYSSKVDSVPMDEIPNLFSAQNKACGISKGMWVRIKSGNYKGDIAQVVAVNESKKRATIKLVPRVDLQAIAKKFGGGQSLKNSAIPAPRLISSHELEDFRPHIEVRRDREMGEIFEVLDGLMLKDGYLYKRVSMSSLIYWGVQPSKSELAMFEDDGKDEDKDVSWLSSVYKSRMKRKLSEPSNQKDVDKQRNTFDLDDLVLFGRKSCGIIIDKGNDSFKILKGNVDSSEIVDINIREIKKNCVDKVFTAPDRCMKTISIDDIVKISEGPLEGREGIVRHMYKGILFIYDECQSENNGFFCANSVGCDIVKKSKEQFGGKSGSKAGPSFAQSPLRSPELEEDPNSSGRNRRNNTQGTFSVGQTLRIRKGPLKGYLCRVVRIFRADVTVKLDSLAKLLTVDEKLLSFANSKRDDATTMQGDIFGSQEERPIGGLLDEGGGLGNNSQWNAGVSSFGGDSWDAPPSSIFQFDGENRNKDKELEATDSWGQALSSNAEANSLWNKSQTAENGVADTSNQDGNCKGNIDAWDKPAVRENTATGGWKSDKLPSQDTWKTWGTKGASDGWDKAPNSVSVEGGSDIGGWSTAKVFSTDPGESQSLGGEDGWNKVSPKASTATCGWEKPELLSSGVGGSWTSKGASVGWDKSVNHDSVQGTTRASGWNTAKLSSPEFGKSQSLDDDGWNKGAVSSSGWEEANLPSDVGGSWTMKGSPADRTKEATGKDKAEVFRGGEWGGNYTSPKVAEASQEKNPSASNPWESSVDNSKQSAAWQSRSTHVKQACSWGDSADTSAASVKTGSQTSNWDNVKTSTTSERDKSKRTVETGNWNTTANDGGWGASTSSATAPAETGGPTGNWDNVSTSGPSAWEKSKPEGASETGSWNNTGFSSESQTNGWNKQKLSNVDQTSGWNKAGTAEGGKDGWKDSLDKQKNSVGHSSGQWSAGNAKTNGSDWGGGSDWSQGRSNNENFSTSDRSNSWNDQKDFDGGRAYNRGRGRGRYGGRGFRNGENSGKPGDSDVSWRFGRGFRNEDNSGKPDDSDGNWKFGRGGSRGRGRNGGCSFNRDSSDDTQQFGRGRGRGRGRGNGRGQFESSDWWKSRQSSENDGGSSIKSDWGVTEASGWSSGWSGSSGGNAEISAGNMDQKVGWSGKSSGGQRSSGWGNVPGEVKDYTITDHTSGWNQSSKSDATVGESKWNSKIASGWSGSRGGNAEKSAGNMDQKVGWSSGKSLGGVGSSGWGNASDITGEVKDDTIIDRSSCWNHSLKSDATLGDAKWNSKIATSSQPVDWKMKEIKSASTSNSTEPSFADWVHGLPQNKASTNEGNWSNEKSSPRDDAGRLTANDWCQSSTAKKEKHSSDNDCGWGGHDENTRGNYSSSANDHIWAKGKEPSSDSKSVCTGIWGSSKGWGDNSGEQGQQSTTAWETSKEPNSKSNWSGQASDSSGNQISGWNNGGGNQWSKPKAFGVDDQFASNDSLYKGSGNQAQSGNWRHESDQGQPFGGRGRGNTFSTRGRGRGRNYGGRHSYGWNSGDGSGRDGNRYNDRRDTSHSNQNELKSGGGWSSGAIAEKGSWDSWKSERQSQPAGWANMSSGKGDSGKSSWDSPKDCGSSRSGWESASDKENATSEVGGEVHKKISDGADGAGGWNTKGSDGRSGQSD